MDASLHAPAMTATASSSRFGDTMPHIIAAGKTSVLDLEGTKAAFAVTERPPTPPEMKKYRKSTLHQPGTRIVHPGAADDAIPEHIVFGAATIPSEPVGDVIASYPSSELARWTLDRSEDVYASVRREPLGRGYTRGHALPDGLGTTKGFGVDGEVAPTSSVVNGLIFPKDTEYLAGDAETSDAHKMYVKTHGNYAPGEQKRRDYDWAAAGVDPNATTFGAVDTAKYDQFEGVAKALNPLKDETMPHYSASIVDARVEAFNATNRDELGKVKNLGLGEEIPDGHVFGAPSRKTIEWDAGKLIKGDYSEEAQLPDADLGKSMKHQGYVYDPSDGSAAALPAGADPSRAFGVPSTRRDLAAIREKSTRSVADVTNYGDEPSASAIIFPPNGADRGVEEGDYLATYDAEALRAFYATTGIEVGTEEAFASAFERAKALDGTPGGCTIGTFQRVRMYDAAAAM